MEESYIKLMWKHAAEISCRDSRAVLIWLIVNSKTPVAVLALTHML